PLGPEKGNNDSISLGLVDGVPFLSTPQFSGILSPVSRACKTFPKATLLVAISNTIGLFFFVGSPYATGFVPKNLSFPPYGTTILSDCVIAIPTIFSLAACLTKYDSAPQ